MPLGLLYLYFDKASRSLINLIYSVYVIIIRFKLF